MIGVFALMAVLDAGAGAARALQRSQAPRRSGAPGPQPQSRGGNPS
jgi:hypothetical protein